MLDLLYFLIAVGFILVTSPLWFLLGAGWAVVIFLFKMVSYCFQVVSGFFRYGEDFDHLLLLLLTPFVALWDAIGAFFQPIGWVWDFARYDHPWWSLVIMVFLWIGYSVLSDN